MSMAWIPVPGQTWLGAASSFLAMWVVMTMAMMLPSLVPRLWRYRLGKNGEPRPSWLTALVGMGYFFVWTVLGIVLFPLGATLAEMEMQYPALARVVPLAAGLVVAVAGAFQFSPAKALHLASCRHLSGPERTLPGDAGSAWRQGVRLGLHCTYGCVGFTAILLALGVMNLWVMALVTAAITAERLATNGERIARAIGIVVVGIGLLLIARAAGGLG